MSEYKKMVWCDSMYYPMISVDVPYEQYVEFVSYEAKCKRDNEIKTFFKEHGFENLGDNLSDTNPYEAYLMNSKTLEFFPISEIYADHLIEIGFFNDKDLFKTEEEFQAFIEKIKSRIIGKKYGI